MKDRITFRSVARTDIGGGVTREDRTDVDTVWAEVRALQGREYYQSRSGEQGAIDYEIRARSPLPSGQRPASNWDVVWKGRSLSITAPPVEENGFYIIRASEREDRQ